MKTNTQAHGARWATRGMLTAAVVVACAAGVTTAHGLYEVAVAAQIPRDIAWLYPVITDGLALVAYAATSRLAGAGRRYAWMVVVLAAGLSGVAQASYLAVGVAGAPAQLRFGIGAWPAIAAAIAAHLLFLLGTRPGRTTPVQAERSLNAEVVQPVGLYGPVQPEPVRLAGLDAVQADPAPVYNPPAAESDEPVVRPGVQPAAPVVQGGVRTVAGRRGSGRTRRPATMPGGTASCPRCRT